MSTLTAKGSTRAWRKLRAAVLDRDGYRCYWCGKRATTVDHLQARVHGGTDDPSNLVAACVRCNCGRGARLRSGVRPASPPSRQW